MTLQDIKETKRYGWTHGRTGRQRENSILTTNKVCGGYNNKITHLVLRTRQIGHILINVNTSFRNTL